MNTFDTTDAFDRWLDTAYRHGETPPFALDAIKNVAGTLHGAWLAVQSEFGEKAQPAHALALLPLIESERVRIEAATHAGISSEDRA